MLGKNRRQQEEREISSEMGWLLKRGLMRSLQELSRAVRTEHCGRLSFTRSPGVGADPTALLLQLSPLGCGTTGLPSVESCQPLSSTTAAHTYMLPVWKEPSRKHTHNLSAPELRNPEPRRPNTRIRPTIWSQGARRLLDPSFYRWSNNQGLTKSSDLLKVADSGQIA